MKLILICGLSIYSERKANDENFFLVNNTPNIFYIFHTEQNLYKTEYHHELFKINALKVIFNMHNFVIYTSLDILGSHTLYEN